MVQIKQFISALPIAAALRHELADEALLQEHRFYLSLVQWLAPAFPTIADEQLAALSGYSYLYFRFLLGLDAVLDQPAGGAAATAPRIFAYLSMHELAVRGLAQLFPVENDFWPAFEQCKQEYAQANLREKQLAAQRLPVSEADFEELAAGKSAVCYALGYALRSLGQDAGPVQDIRHCLRHLHIAMQYLDDIEDFATDWQQGQYTYAHTQVEAYLKDRQLDAQQLAARELRQHLYTSGVAQQLLSRGHAHYSSAIALAHALGLSSLAQYIEQQLAKCRNYQLEVAYLLQKTRIKASKSFALAHARPPELSPLALHTAVQQALRHLRLSRDEQGCWSDFMTSAGQSKLWATAYAGLLLAEVTEALPLAHDAFKGSFYLPASYNESILQDGDSTNFAMGLRRRVWGEATAPQLTAWLTFMEADGGWVTYRDANQLRRRLELPAEVSVEGWLTPKLCVTAAAAYVLSLYDELAPQHQASCAYLAQHQHPNGYWAAYWWTSPIYATAFAVQALAPLAGYGPHRAAALRWLAAQQTPAGAWCDASTNAQPSAFYTALAIKALLTEATGEYTAAAERGVRWLLGQQTSDGSWLTSRILRIPATTVHDPATVRQWRASSFGVNVVVDDHNRVFTTSTVLNALHAFAKTAVPSSHLS